MPVHPEREKMPPDVRRGALLSDLEALFSGPTSPTTIASAPQASRIDGLCQRDVIHLWYRRVAPDKPNSRLEPVSISVSTEYHKLDSGPIVEKGGRQNVCRKLSGAKTYWAQSDSEDTAEAALTLLTAAVENVKAGDRFTIDCRELDIAEGTTCESEFLTAASRVSSLDRCFEMSNCYTLAMNGYYVTIINAPSEEVDGRFTTAIKIEPLSIVVT